MKQVLFILTAREAAVFSERAATQGGHRTLAYPTGASLLGWAAAQGPYLDFKDPFNVFHSGKVRFSNAIPLTDSGAPTYAAPQLLMRPKNSRGEEAMRLLRVGRRKGDGEQFEALSRSLFLTGAGAALEPDLDGRLRTATFGGRAATGQLFGYQHIAADGAPRYAATLEADAIGEDDWTRLLDAFRNRTLHLGRAAGTAYGGSYECVEAPDQAVDLWPHGGASAGTERVRVWALSDLALTDDTGAPCFQPTAAMLGLASADKARFDPTDSAIGVRRYAPRNSALGRRDIERQVIAAGSVITFRYEGGAPGFQGARPVGLWREAGLGRIWVAPPLLTTIEPGDPPGAGEAFPVAPPRMAEEPGPSPCRPSEDPVAEWLGALA